MASSARPRTQLKVSTPQTRLAKRKLGELKYGQTSEALLTEPGIVCCVQSTHVLFCRLEYAQSRLPWISAALRAQCATAVLDFLMCLKHRSANTGCIHFWMSSGQIACSKLAEPRGITMLRDQLRLLITRAVLFVVGDYNPFDDNGFTQRAAIRTSKWVPLRQLIICTDTDRNAVNTKNDDQANRSPMGLLTITQHQTPTTYNPAGHLMRIGAQVEDRHRQRGDLSNYLQSKVKHGCGCGRYKLERTLAGGYMLTLSELLFRPLLNAHLAAFDHSQTRFTNGWASHSICSWQCCYCDIQPRCVMLYFGSQPLADELSASHGPRA